MIRAGGRLLIAFALVSALPACGVSGLNFSKDERVTITAPHDRARVSLPVEIRWTYRDFRVTGPSDDRSPDAGFFGVYVDRAPQPPGRTQSWLVREDRQCRVDPACPNEAYLAGINIYSTTEPTFTVTQLPAPRTDAPRRREFHEATVVLLNGRGERIGESAFTVQFEVDRGP